MNVVWSGESKTQVQKLFFWYQDQFENAIALKGIKSIQKSVALLKRNPYRGRVEEEFKYLASNVILRSIIQHKNLKIIYYIENNTIYIADIWVFSKYL